MPGDRLVTGAELEVTVAYLDKNNNLGASEGRRSAHQTLVPTSNLSHSLKLPAKGSISV